MGSPSNSADSETLLERIHESSRVEQDKIIQMLHDRAEGSGAAADWSNLAIGLSQTGRLDEAIHIWEQLVEVMPELDHNRMNLALAYRAVHQFELARYQFEYLATHAATDEAREWGREQAQALARYRGSTYEQQELQGRQLSALHERVTFDEASAEDYVRLGRLILATPPETGEDRSIEEAGTLLEAGHRKYPNYVGILELLAACYARSDPKNRLNDVLRLIEQQAPDSEVLRIARNIDQDSGSAYQGTLIERVQHLLQQTQRKDVEVRDAALRDLRFIVRAYPQNPDYRWYFAFALIGAGQQDEALKHAEVLAAAAGESHRLHFNVAQIFWHCGDQVRAERHLDLALQYAKTEEDRESVHYLRAEILKG